MDNLAQQVVPVRAQSKPRNLWRVTVMRHHKRDTVQEVVEVEAGNWAVAVGKAARQLKKLPGFKKKKVSYAVMSVQKVDVPMPAPAEQEKLPMGEVR